MGILKQFFVQHTLGDACNWVNNASDIMTVVCWLIYNEIGRSQINITQPRMALKSILRNCSVEIPNVLSSGLPLAESLDSSILGSYDEGGVNERPLEPTEIDEKGAWDRINGTRDYSTDCFNWTTELGSATNHSGNGTDDNSHYDLYEVSSCYLRISTFNYLIILMSYFKCTNDSGL